MLHQSLGFRRRLALGVASGVLAAALAVPGAGLAQPAGATNPWGVPLTDVTVDPAVKYGRLANGMRYAIVRNATPKGAAAVRMHFEFGSIGENDKERGLAHFIEHMAFNGSTNVPEGDMIKILERQGLKFGPDTNASTGFDETIYMLDLPKADDERVDTALMLMREVAGEVKFDAAAIDRERGVILGERRVRDTYQLAQVTDLIGFQVPNTPYPNRLPIGTEDVLKTASAETMRALYHRYYRPEYATIVFVGDADPTLIEAKIEAKFSDWKGVGPAAAPLPRGTIDLKRAADFDTFVDPAVATTVSLTSFRPWQNPADTLANRRIDTTRALALAMFNRRFQRAVNAPGSVLLGGGMNENPSKDAAIGTGFTVAAKDGAWKEALAVTEQELRRALSHGFSASEFELQRSDTLGKLKAAADQADARSHAAIANAILATVGEPDFVTTPEFRRAYFAAVAPTLTLAEVNAQFREMWSGSAPLVHVSSKQAIDETALAATFAGSTKVAVAAPKEEAAVAFAYDRFGAPGAIVEDRRIDDLGIRTVRFANNVRLNIKQTDFEKGKVSFAVRLAGGSLALPTDKPGLATMVSALSALSATGKHSLEDIKTVTAGRLVTPGVVVASDALAAGGTTTAPDLALQMKLSAAYLTDPGYRAEAGSQWLNLVPVFDKQISSTPGSVAGARLPAILASNDGRFGLAPADELLKRNFDEARPLLAGMIASAPIEVGVVGDIDEALAIKAVAESFGALPARAAAAPDYAAARKATFRADRAPILLTHSGGADQALVGAAWPTDDDTDYRAVVGMSLLKDVMSLMLTETVREQLGASYGVSVASTMSDTYDGFGYMFVNSVVAPDKADEIDAAIATVARSLRDTPVSADLLARARAPMLEETAKNLRLNNYWIGFVDQAQSESKRLDRVRQRAALIAAVTPSDLQALARRYLTDQRLQRVRIVSDKASVAVAGAPVAR